MSALLKLSLPAGDGKGGGSSRIAQGGGGRIEGLDEALATAAGKLQSP